MKNRTIIKFLNTLLCYSACSYCFIRGAAERGLVHGNHDRAAHEEKVILKGL